MDGVPVAKLAEWDFKLLVYYVKLCNFGNIPVVLANINNNSQRIIEDHQNLATLNEHVENYPSVIIQSHITKNIDLSWEIVNEHLEAIHGKMGVHFL